MKRVDIVCGVAYPETKDLQAKNVELATRVAKLEVENSELRKRTKALHDGNDATHLDLAVDLAFESETSAGKEYNIALAKDELTLLRRVASAARSYTRCAGEFFDTIVNGECLCRVCSEHYDMLDQAVDALNAAQAKDSPRVPDER